MKMNLGRILIMVSNFKMNGKDLMLTLESIKKSKIYNKMLLEYQT